LKKRITIAVRELVEYVLHSGNLELGFMATDRSIAGIRAHQKIQRMRPETYVPEVPVTHQIETDRFVLEIGGRIDGVYTLDGSAQPHDTNDTKTKSKRVIIDEIKSTNKDLAHFEKNPNPIHWGQVKCYAYFYGISNGLNDIETQLTYYHLESGKTLEIRQPFTIVELARDFEKLISRYLEWADRISKWHAIRDTSIAPLQFPFANYRPGQRQMAVDTYRTIRNKSQLIVQAATGIGKTMAAIFPGVKAIAEGHHEKIFYLTGRTTGRIAAEKAFDELKNKGLKLKSLTLTAKEKICFNPDHLCSADECTYAKGYYDRIDDALERISIYDTFTRDRVAEIARAFQVCPFEFSLDLSVYMDCIICDYNYAFDPKVYLRRFFAEGTGSFTFFIDEAHNLVDRARSMFSAEITKQPFLDLRRALKQALPHIFKCLGKVNSWLVKARKKCDAAGGTITEPDLPDDLLPLLKRFLRDTERWLSFNLKTAFRQELLDLYFSVSAFMRVADQYNQKYATCYEKTGKDLRLKLFCMDPSKQMADALRRCQAAVFFSATMTPADYFIRIFGCNAEAAKRIIASPFPEDNLGLFVADRVSTFYRERDQTKAAVSDALLTLVNGKKGNYLVFFTSYAYMDMIYREFCEKASYMETIRQTRKMSEPEREGFLDRFSRKNPDTLVGFAVMGGIFGEGIDLVGDRLCGVAIIGVGLPGISIENELIRAYFAGVDETGFEYAYLYPGINRVLQAAGRVIRTSRDRGVVLLIDKRFSTFRYRTFFPSTWNPVKVQDEKKLETGLKVFWEKSSQAEKRGT
jgi:DNA excision repair protein ERCC-2